MMELMKGEWRIQYETLGCDDMEGWVKALPAKVSCLQWVECTEVTSRVM